MGPRLTSWARLVLSWSVVVSLMLVGQRSNTHGPGGRLGVMGGGVGLDREEIGLGRLDLLSSPVALGTGPAPTGSSLVCCSLTQAFALSSIIQPLFSFCS